MTTTNPHPAELRANQAHAAAQAAGDAVKLAKRHNSHGIAAKLHQDAHAEHLVETGRADNPHSYQVTAEREAATAHMWAARAHEAAARDDDEDATTNAHVASLAAESATKACAVGRAMMELAGNCSVGARMIAEDCAVVAECAAADAGYEPAEGS